MKYILLFFASMWLNNVAAQNLLNLQGWQIGQGNITSFAVNGEATENERIWGTGPLGNQVVLWRAKPSAIANGNGDGGWDTSPFAIVHTNMYRFTVWLKKINSNDGTSYLGTNGVNNLDGTVSPNPYFWYGDLPALNKWYLIVGYIHGSGDPSTISYGGVYDGITGAKLVSITDFKFAIGATTSRHRSYLYYNTNANDEQYFYAPRVDLVDGNEPSIATLLNNGGVAAIVNNFNVKTFGRGGGYTAVSVLNPAATQSIALGYDVSTNASNNFSGQGHEIVLKNGVEFVTPNAANNSYYKTVMSLFNGNVGIGISAPAEKLTVNGKIRAKEVKVEAANWPDYVFREDYQLTSLTELENYIKANQHLSEMPTAKAVADHGIELGEMNKLLLKKIEELTLLLIDQNKKNNKQDQLINQLSAELIELKKNRNQKN